MQTLNVVGCILCSILDINMNLPCNSCFYHQMKKLKELRLLLGESGLGISLTVRKYAMISLMEVFKDIVPGYRMRIPTDKEKSQKVNMLFYLTIYRACLLKNIIYFYYYYIFFYYCLYYHHHNHIIIISIINNIVFVVVSVVVVIIVFIAVVIYDITVPVAE